MARAQSTGGWASAWTQEEIDILKLNYPELGAKRIAALLPGRHVGAIKVKASKLGVAMVNDHANHFKLTEPERAAVVAAYQDGLSAASVCAKLSVGRSEPLTVDNVYAVLKLAGIQADKSGARNRKLSDHREREIAAAYRNGASLPELSARFSVGVSSLHYMLRRIGVKLRAPGYRHANKASRSFKTADGYEIVFRSTWEFKTAVYLDAMHADWSYEAAAFTVVDTDGATFRYTPDFWIYSQGGHLERVIDVKGLQDPEQMRRIALFTAQFPDVPFAVWFETDLRARGILTPRQRRPSMARAQSTDL